MGKNSAVIRIVVVCLLGFLPIFLLVISIITDGAAHKTPARLPRTTLLCLFQELSLLPFLYAVVFHELAHGCILKDLTTSLYIL